MAEERVALSELKDQHSNELVKQKTKLDDACKHHQNTLKEEQGKLQVKEDQLGAAKFDIETLEKKVLSLSKDIERLQLVVDGATAAMKAISGASQHAAGCIRTQVSNTRHTLNIVCELLK